MKLPDWLVWQLFIEMIVIGLVYLGYKDVGRGMYFILGGVISLVATYMIK